MRVLITGGAGFIGSHLAAHFCRRSEVRVLDNLRTGFRRNLDGLRAEFLEGSILDAALVRQAVTGVDYVFHLAATVSVPESFRNPLECEQVNVAGFLNVLEAAAAAHVKKLCLASSSAVYGDSLEIPKREEMAPDPRSPYAVSKLAGEYYAALFAGAYGLPTVCPRFFNVFGARQDPASPYAAAVPAFISRALRNEPLTIFGDGEQTRDFVSVRDVVAACDRLTLASDATGVFNVAAGGRMTISSLAREVVRLTASRSEIRHLPPRPGDVRHSQASIDRLLATGFRPAMDFPAALAETIEFCRGEGQALGSGS